MRAADEGDTRAALAAGVRNDRDAVVAMAKTLVACPSGTPPGDTTAVAEAAARLVADVPAIEVERHRSAPHVVNLVMRVRGARPGRRLVFNGHMDTFPLANREQWTLDPAGEERGGRLYGVGVSDMKAGLAAILLALRHLAARRDAWAGEVVATFAGDEETMGELGSQYLLDTVPHAKGGAMVSTDAGSLRVLRFGEKGMIWLTLRAKGRAAHAAHVHRGDSAIDKLLAVVAGLQALRDWPVKTPPAISQAIAAAAGVSEPLSGTGESAVLTAVTVTLGTIHGGRLRNLVADEAEASADIRLPAGVTVAQIEDEIHRIVAAHPGVECVIERRYEPNWTSPDHEIVERVARNCAAVLGAVPARSMRVGASDARLYRRAGVPTVVCGLTPHNMGAPDEYVEIDELAALGEILALTAYDYLNAG